jgi:aspartyl/glutamyl-tRNA(Asn/Gln) amidotransferase C subunit
MAQVLFARPSNDQPELRDDTPVPCDIADAVLAQAPDAAKPFFRVPRVIER